MMPNTSPNRSLKPGPTTPCGSVCQTSLMSLRTRCQVAGTSAAVTLPCRSTKIVVAARPRVAAQHVQARHLLQLALEPLGDLEQRVVERGARPARRPRPWSGW